MPTWYIFNVEPTIEENIILIRPAQHMTHRSTTYDPQEHNIRPTGAFLWPIRVFAVAENIAKAWLRVNCHSKIFSRLLHNEVDFCSLWKMYVDQFSP